MRKFITNTTEHQFSFMMPALISMTFFQTGVQAEEDVLATATFALTPLQSYFWGYWRNSVHFKEQRHRQAAVARSV
jgi:hypothetical protein